MCLDQLLNSVLVGFKMFLTVLWFIWASLVAQRLKHLPGMRETWV